MPVHLLFFFFGGWGEALFACFSLWFWSLTQKVNCVILSNHRKIEKHERASRRESINKLWHIYIVIHIIAIKMKKTLCFKMEKSWKHNIGLIKHLQMPGKSTQQFQGSYYLWSEKERNSIIGWGEEVGRWFNCISNVLFRKFDMAHKCKIISHNCIGWQHGWWPSPPRDGQNSHLQILKFWWQCWSLWRQETRKVAAHKGIRPPVWLSEWTRLAPSAHSRKVLGDAAHCAWNSSQAH